VRRRSSACSGATSPADEIAEQRGHRRRADRQRIVAPGLRRDRLLAQQSLVQRAQPRARRRAKLRLQEPAHVVEDAQRLGDPPALGEGLHEVAVARLAVRRRLDQPARGALGRRQPRAAEREAAGGDALQRPQAHLLEAPALVLGPARADLGQEAALGDLERDVGGGRRLGPVRALQRALGALDRRERRLDVDRRARRQHEPQVRPAGDGAVAERLAQPRQQRVERAVRRCRRLVGPQDVDELVAPDGARAVQDEIGEQQPRLPAADAGLEPRSRRAGPRRVGRARARVRVGSPR
jgi:hypothetical protein